MPPICASILLAGALLYAARRVLRAFMSRAPRLYDTIIVITSVAFETLLRRTLANYRFGYRRQYFPYATPLRRHMPPACAVCRLYGLRFTYTHYTSLILPLPLRHTITAIVIAMPYYDIYYYLSKNTPHKRSHYYYLPFSPRLLTTRARHCLILLISYIRYTYTIVIIISWSPMLSSRLLSLRCQKATLRCCRRCFTGHHYHHHCRSLLVCQIRVINYRYATASLHYHWSAFTATHWFVIVGWH